MTTPSPSSSLRPLYRLQAPVKQYAWGSTTLLADLTGTEPSGTPQAEMWFGTHPTTPTLLADDGTALADLVELPYLVKLLAAQQPLSIQAHPTIEQARAGFAAENATGIPLGDPRRTYRDANHKPEMLVALTPFVALAGFRDPSASAGTFRLLAQLVEVPEISDALTTMADQLAAGELKTVFECLVDLAGPFWRPNGWTSHIMAALDRHGPDDPILHAARRAAAIHPDDPGALVAVLMNLTELAPGEALFVPSGTIHAYLSGLGLEVMASSDNVIRGGLTVKHVDVAELDRVVTYSAGPAPVITPSVRTIDDVRVARFTPPVSDFALTRFDLPPATSLTITAETPHIAVGTSGVGSLTAGSDSARVTPGTGIYLPGIGGSVEISAGDDGLTLFMANQP